MIASQITPLLKRALAMALKKSLNAAPTVPGRENREIHLWLGRQMGHTTAIASVFGTRLCQGLPTVILIPNVQSRADLTLKVAKHTGMDEAEVRRKMYSTGSMMVVPGQVDSIDEALRGTRIDIRSLVIFVEGYHSISRTRGGEAGRWCDEKTIQTLKQKYIQHGRIDPRRIITAYIG